MLSFWERQSLCHCDVAIIGGGITGLSVAASLAEQNPALDIALFERSTLPYGASTRNAGFACFGSLTEVLSDIRQMGPEKARELVKLRWQGLNITRARLGDSNIGYQASGGFELLTEALEESLDHLTEVNDLLKDMVGDYLSLDAEVGRHWGIADHQPIVAMKGEGQVDTGRLIKALHRHVAALGVRIHSGSKVTEVVQDGNWKLTLEDQVRSSLPFQADQIIHCTNAFTHDLLPKTKLVPGRGQVLITHPIRGLKFQGNLHIDEGYYYLRNVGDRLLFGGGRNLDFEQEETTALELNLQLQAHLDETLQNLFPEIRFEVDQRWAGIMAFGEDKFPLVKDLGNGAYCALKMGGMGIALAGSIGAQVAEMIRK